MLDDMKHIPGLLLFCMAPMSAWAANAVVTDFFNVSGNSDVIGNRLQFDTQSIQVATGVGTLTIDILTNFDNPNLNSFRDAGVRLDIGDLFITVDGAYAYGIPLAYHNGPAGGPWGTRLYAGHIYEIDGPSALMTARQVLHDPMYVDYRPDEIVWMIGNGGVEDVTVGTPAVQVLPIAGNDGVNGPLYDIRINTSLPAGLFQSQTDFYGLSFALATCGNDMVKGQLNLNPDLSLEGLGAPDAPVPEPSTFYLVIAAVLIVASRIAVGNLREKM
jgi:hypothetical protein